MECKYCGTELNKNARFCKKCGRAIETEMISEIVLEPLRWSEEENVDIFFKEIRERLEWLAGEYVKQEEKMEDIVNENKKLKNSLAEKVGFLEKKETEVSILKKSLEEQKKENERLKNSLEKMEQEVKENRVDDLEILQRNICPNCHAPIDEKTIFCGECGIKVR